MFDWNDLRYFLAVARHASLSGAARELSVSQSTVLRRIAALEEGVGHRLFDRLPSGYVLAPEGKDMLCLAQRIEEQVLALDRTMAGRCALVGGPLRVATSDVLAQTILSRHLVSFCRKYPEVRIELFVGDDYVDLARREADVAFRAGRPEQNCLFGRQVTTFAWAVYGGAEYLSRHPLPGGQDELARHHFVGFAGKMGSIAAASWLTEHVAPERIVYRTNSLIHMSHLLRLGLGLGLLPCVIADPDPGLVRVMPPIPRLNREGWLVTHEDLKDNTRVQCFLGEIGRAIAAERLRHLGVVESDNASSPKAVGPNGVGGNAPLHVESARS
jgi:DNA-binding transcriptional LysR family regulator